MSFMLYIHIYVVHIQIYHTVIYHINSISKHIFQNNNTKSNIFWLCTQISEVLYKYHKPWYTYILLVNVEFSTNKYINYSFLNCKICILVYSRWGLFIQRTNYCQLNQFSISKIKCVVPSERIKFVSNFIIFTSLKTWINYRNPHL